MRTQVQPSVRVAKEEEEEEEARGCVIRGAAIQKLVAEQIPFPVAHPLNRFRLSPTWMVHSEWGP